MFTDSASSSDALSEYSSDCGRHLFSGEDSSGVGSGVFGDTLFLFRDDDDSKPTFSSSNTCMTSKFGDRRRPRCLLLESDAVRSRNACLEAPILTSFFNDERGVKKRLNRLGVTVGSCLGRLPSALQEGAGVGKLGSFLSGVVALVVALRSLEAPVWPAIAIMLKLYCLLGLISKVRRSDGLLRDGISVIVSCWSIELIASLVLP